MNQYSQKNTLIHSVYIYSTKKVIQQLLWIFLFASYPLLVTAQIDSLQQELQNLPESIERVNTLNKLSLLYRKNDFVLSAEYAEQALALANQLDYIKGKATAYYYLSVSSSAQGNQKLSREQNKQAILLASSIQANDILIRAYNVLAINQGKEGKIKASTETYLKGLKLAEKENDDWGLSILATNLGDIFASNNDFSKARSYYEQSAQVARRIKNYSTLSWNNRQIAESYFNENNLEKATFYFDEALKFSEKVGGKRSMAFIKSALAKVYMAAGKEKLAIINGEESMQLMLEAGDNEGLIDAIRILMDIYLKTNQPNKVIALGQEAAKIRGKINQLDPIIELQELMAKAHARKYEFEKAYQLNVAFHENKDSLNNQNRLNAALELEKKYQLEKKEKENLLLKAAQQKQAAIIQNQKVLNFFLCLVAGLVSLLGFVGYKAYKEKTKNNLVLEEKVKERTTELLETNQELVQSNEELSRFAHVASHDLREPLGNITNFIRLLQNEIDEINFPNAFIYMDIITKSSNHMDNLISDTLEFTQLSNKKVKHELVDLNEIIENIETVITTTLRKKQATIEILTTLPTIPANPARIFSLFKNLIENGIKYNQSQQPKIKIDYKDTNTFYQFSVKDNGVGIQKEYHQTIFEMYKRLQNREQYEGSGLGLSNCQKIISMLGGKMWVESEEGHGSTFFFTIAK